MWELASFILKIASYAVVLSAAGGALFLILFPTLNVRERNRVVTMTLGLALAGSLLTAMAIPLRSGFLSGMGLSGMFEPFYLNMLFESVVGTSTKLRWLGLALIGFVWLRRPLGYGIGALGAVLTVASFALIGHTADLEARLAGGGLIALHLLAVSFWIGALWPLIWMSYAPDTSRVARVLERFGTLAMVLVGALILAGGSVAWLLLDQLSTLWESHYGNLLVFKLLVFISLLALAGLNRFRLVPRFAEEVPGASVALRRSIALEVVAVGAILAITAALTTFASPFES
ncbi:MAG: putative copper resistance protein D [Halomonadaceae bacterium T82-2]|nr:MAG: putative copper resistance protein D [Halomonadaceae bacterium T82-2]